MKRSLLCTLIAVVGILFCAPHAFAVSIIGGPGPSGFGNDDFTEIFTPSTEVITIELYDVAGQAGFPSYFGFYFVSNPDSLIPIFLPEDQGGEQAARIDFTAGEVVDINDNAIEATFTPGANDIGFFYTPDFSAIGVDQFILYTQSVLNLGVDAAATFPNLSDPEAYLIGFEIFNPDLNDFQTLSIEIVAGVSPASVPEPASLALLTFGLLGLALINRKNKHRIS